MNRPEKEITSRDEMLSIIERSLVCRLAMCDGDRPYVVPMCFGMAGGRLYFHSAAEGLKIEILRKNPNVCVEFDIDVEVVPRDRACATTAHYRSVIVSGMAMIVETEEERRYGLDIISQQYLDRVGEYSAQAMEKTVVFRMDIEQMTGKKSGY